MSSPGVTCPKGQKEVYQGRILIRFQSNFSRFFWVHHCWKLMCYPLNGGMTPENQSTWMSSEKSDHTSAQNEARSLLMGAKRKKKDRWSATFRSINFGPAFIILILCRLEKFYNVLQTSLFAVKKSLKLHSLKSVGSGKKLIRNMLKAEECM